VAALNSATSSAGSRPPVLHIDVLRLPHSRTSVPSTALVGVLVPARASRRAPPRRAAHAYRASASRSARAFPAFKSISCSVLSGLKRTVPSASPPGAGSHGAGRQGEASDSDPLTVAEYVTHCPKIFVR
jgi:hypothetical protein